MWPVMGLGAEGKGEAVGTEVRKVFRCEVDGDLYGNGGRVVEQHEPLQRLMALLVGGCNLQG